MRRDRGGSWAAIYDMATYGGLEEEIWRCQPCTDRLGPVTSNARPHDGDMRPYQGLFPTDRGEG